MGSEWKEISLQTFINFNPKESIPKGMLKKKVSMDALIPFNKKIPSYSNERYYGGAKFRNGDVIMARITPSLENGKTALVNIFEKDETGFGSTEFIVLRAKEGVSNKDFIFYLSTYRLFRNIAIHSMTGSSGRQRVQLDVLKRSIFKLPPLPEQKVIAHILGTLDEKIELNRRMNATLEQMAQAMFKSWFVDFDPVIDKALAAGNSIPEPLQNRAEKRKALGDKRKPLPEDIQKLFPDAFEFSEELDKWVPKGWEVKPVDKMIQINPRVTLRKETIAPFVDMKALPTSGYSVSNVISKEYKGGAKFEKDDVLLARITPCLENGKAGVVDFLNEGEVGFGSTEFIILRGKEAVKTPFIACLIRDSKFRKHATQSMVGSSGRQRVQNACFSSYYLATPDDVLLNNFDRLISSNFKTITQNKEEINTITNLRDTLLPKLISGEIRIPEAHYILRTEANLNMAAEEAITFTRK